VAARSTAPKPVFGLRLVLVTEREHTTAVRTAEDFVSLFLIAKNGSETDKLAVRNGLGITKNNASKITAQYIFDAE
jgi:hypothetical protein